MKRGVSALGAAATSLLSHGVLAWSLLAARQPLAHPARIEHFDVRMLELAEPPPMRTEPPPPPQPPVSKPAPPRPKPRPAAEPPPALPRPATAPPSAPAPEAARQPDPAPAALLDLSQPASPFGVATGAGYGLGSSTASTGPTRPAPEPVPVNVRQALPFAKVGDLSRKPRAPSLDARLRQHYPAELRRRGVSGQAEVRVLIDAHGDVEALELVSESVAGFGSACEQTLRDSVWSVPLDRDGDPVRTRISYRCRFEIDR